MIVWNQTRKRDTWGQHRQIGAAGGRRDAHRRRRDLRIVPEDVWTAVHERLRQRRAVYLTSTGGRAMGRPVAGTVSPYLLTGIRGLRRLWRLDGGAFRCHATGAAIRG